MRQLWRPKRSRKWSSWKNEFVCIWPKKLRRYTKLCLLPDQIELCSYFWDKHTKGTRAKGQSELLPISICESGSSKIALKAITGRRWQNLSFSKSKLERRYFNLYSTLLKTTMFLWKSLENASWPRHLKSRTMSQVLTSMPANSDTASPFSNGDYSNRFKIQLNGKSSKIWLTSATSTWHPTKPNMRAEN